MVRAASDRPRHWRGAGSHPTRRRAGRGHSPPDVPVRRLQRQQLCDPATTPEIERPCSSASLEPGRQPSSRTGQVRVGPREVAINGCKEDRDRQHGACGASRAPLRRSRRQKPAYAIGAQPFHDGGKQRLIAPLLDVGRFGSPAPGSDLDAHASAPARRADQPGMNEMRMAGIEVIFQRIENARARGLQTPPEAIHGRSSKVGGNTRKGPGSTANVVHTSPAATRTGSARRACRRNRPIPARQRSRRRLRNGNRDRDTRSCSPLSNRATGARRDAGNDHAIGRPLPTAEQHQPPAHQLRPSGLRPDSDCSGHRVPTGGDAPSANRITSPPAPP